MSVSRDTLVETCNEWLKPEALSDYCPNGLQIQGKADVSKVVAGVTASRALIERAIEARADVLLVHHGFFWKGEPLPITGHRYERISRLIKHDINLLAYHLPLDVHPTLGNNAELARILGLRWEGSLAEQNALALGGVGRCESPTGLSDFARRVQQALGRAPQVIEGQTDAMASNRPVHRIGWCTGAAQGYFEQAIAKGVDLYISGEISEPTVHLARESGVHYMAAGHHATERYGVQALGKALATHFQLAFEYIEISNPV